MGLRAALVALALLAGASAPVVLLPSTVLAQSNDNEYTPLNSRIRRSRPLPLEPRSIWQPHQLSDAQRSRSRTMVAQMARCMWDRGNDRGLDLLARTDFGFLAWEQIGLASDEVVERYPIQTCLSRVARSANSSILLRFDAPSMRSWYLQAAYFAANEDGPTWIRPGMEIAEREYPISSGNMAVRTALDFSDCLVSFDPYGADYFFRTAAASDEERAAVRALVPAMSPCLPDGQELEIDPNALRQWVGESLWHAANHLQAASNTTAESAQ